MKSIRCKIAIIAVVPIFMLGCAPPLNMTTMQGTWNGVALQANRLDNNSFKITATDKEASDAIRSENAWEAAASQLANGKPITKHHSSKCVYLFVHNSGKVELLKEPVDSIIFGPASSGQYNRVVMPGGVQIRTWVTEGTICEK